jgi:MFS family permease
MTELAPPSSRAVASRGYWALLRDNPRLRNIWLAEVVSYLGDWFNYVAIYTAAAELSLRAEAVTAMFVSKLLPVFVMTPFAGPLCDRFDRRKLMIASDVARAVCALLLVVAYRLKSYPLLLGVSLVMVAFAGIFLPAKTAAMPEVVGDADLAAANALGGGTWSVMLTVGAALGGLVTAAIGIEAAFLLDGASFVLSALFLLPIGALRPKPKSDVAHETGYLAGLRYLARRPLLAATVALKPVMSLSGGALAVIPLFAQRIFHGGPTAMGTLWTFRGLGAFLGTLVVPRLFGQSSARMRRLVIPAFAVLGLGYCAVARTTALWQAAAAYFVAAAGSGAIWVLSTTLAQQSSDDAYRGRIFATEWGALTLSLAATGGLSGTLVDRFGWSVRDVTWVSGLVALAPIALWLVVLARARPAPA